MIFMLNTFKSIILRCTVKKRKKKQSEIFLDVESIVIPWGSFLFQIIFYDYYFPKAIQSNDFLHNKI